MKHIFTTIICLLLLVPVVAAQESTFTMNPDGSAKLTVNEAGRDTSTVYPLSPKAVDCLISASLEETVFAETQGITTSSRFSGSEENVAVYQAALGMTGEQVAALAKKRSEKNEARLDVARPLLETLVRFDELSTEELSAFDLECRRVLRSDIAGEQAVLMEVLTPDQLQRMLELELVLPTLSSKILGDVDFAPFVNFDAYNALELTEDQKKQLADIQKEDGKEMAVFMSDFLRDFFKGIRQEIADGKTPTEDDLKVYVEKGKTMKARTKARVLALLTSEQTAKLEKLLADWPKKLEQLKADWLAKQQEKKPEDDAWKKSWKPGDPLPEGAVPPSRPRKAFPFGG